MIDDNWIFYMANYGGLVAEVGQSTYKKGLQMTFVTLSNMVGMAGFEPAISATRTLRSSQTEPHPVQKIHIVQVSRKCKNFFGCTNNLN